MESYESKHSDQSFTSRLAKELGVTAPPLRLDSQAKYGMPPCSVQLPCCACCAVRVVLGMLCCLRYLCA